MDHRTLHGQMVAFFRAKIQEAAQAQQSSRQPAPPTSPQPSRRRNQEQPPRPSESFNPHALIAEIPSWVQRFSAKRELKQYEKMFTAAQRSENKAARREGDYKERTLEKSARRYQAASEALTAWGSRWASGNASIAFKAAELGQEALRIDIQVSHNMLRQNEASINDLHARFQAAVPQDDAEFAKWLNSSEA